MIRPGISNEMLTRAGVRRVNADEAKALCDLAEAGLWLPYRNIDGTAIQDGGNDYGRLRLETPCDGKKYHQAFGTNVHAYLPPTTEASTAGNRDLFVIEGEFKSLALAEAGYPAIGISGFFGFSEKGGEKLVPEMAAAIEYLRPATIYFCGDSDTALNYQFSVAAVRMAKLLQPMPVRLPRIPLNGPGKGADDCREVLKVEFENWWRKCVALAVVVKPDMEPASLAIELFEREQSAIPELAGAARSEAERRLVKLAAALESHVLLQERVLRFLEKKFGLPRRALNKAIKAALKPAQGNDPPERIDVCYDPTRKCYWIPNDREEMIEITETSLSRHLMSAGFINDRDRGERLLDEEINRIQREQDVLYAGPLAGYAVGLQEQCGHRILVTRAARLIEPVAGDCPTIERLLLELLDDPEHDQITYLMGWLKTGYESLRDHQWRPGQALTVAGPRDCGKSLLQNLITEIFGGRSAKPYRYMSGMTEFNGDLFGAEHLMIEDEVASTDIRARRHFGSRIKESTVNQVQSCHAKGRPALSLKPFWRTSITLNDEPENLLILPPIDDSLEDKLILLKAGQATFPTDIATSEGRQRFWAKLMDELPAFIYGVVNYKIPERLRSGRFGIKHFHHPALIGALNEMSPEMRLLGLIDAALDETSHVGQWTGTATQLEKMLFESAAGFEARRLLDWNNATGTYLGRLAKKVPNRVQAQRSSSSRTWSVRPARWVTADSSVEMTPSAFE
jgi:hypothetical protein